MGGSVAAVLLARGRAWKSPGGNPQAVRSIWLGSRSTVRAIPSRRKGCGGDPPGEWPGQSFRVARAGRFCAQKAPFAGPLRSSYPSVVSVLLPRNQGPNGWSAGFWNSTPQERLPQGVGAI